MQRNNTLVQQYNERTMCVLVCVSVCFALNRLYEAQSVNPWSSFVEEPLGPHLTAGLLPSSHLWFELEAVGYTSEQHLGDCYPIIGVRAAQESFEIIPSILR